MFKYMNSDSPHWRMPLVGLVPGSNSSCDPISENDFERQIVWCRNPTKTLEMIII